LASPFASEYQLPKKSPYVEYEASSSLSDKVENALNYPAYLFLFIYLLNLKNNVFFYNIYVVMKFPGLNAQLQD
jgi:type II secretory pathway component PulF